MRKFLRRLIIVFALVLIGGAFWLWNTRGAIYDFSGLTYRANLGEGTRFEPLSGITAPDDMVAAADNERLTLFIDTQTSNIAVLDKESGFLWRSAPLNGVEDPLANPFERGVMRSLAGFTYFDEFNRQRSDWTWQSAAINEQFDIYSIPNGVRVSFYLGDATMGIDAVPKFLTEERFEERLIASLTENSDIRFVRGQFTPSRTHEGFMELGDGIRAHAVNSERMIRIFDDIEYTLEELMEDNELAGHYMEIETDFFTLEIEFIIKDDKLILNMPLSEFDGGEGNRISQIEFMRYFGAGESNETGYLFVPSGSGALINFNNGRFNEEIYRDSVYGLDMLLHYGQRTQLTTPVRLPVLGIQRENAAFVAWVESGAALATVNADVSGHNNSYNTAWFSFLLREHVMLQMMGAFSDGDMTVVAHDAFEGDISIVYKFLANEEANYTGMARGFQRHLEETGRLKRQTEAGPMPFYLDIIGALEKEMFFLGTPYYGIDPLTSYEQAKEIIELLNQNGVNNIHARWLGWFNNEGLNHHGVRRVNLLRQVGSRSQMLELNELLENNGGALYPGVNFLTTAWRTRGLNRQLEIARDPAGFQGVISTYRREIARFRGSPYLTGWFLLKNPGVLPSHVEDFIPAFNNRLGINNLALNDMGNLLTSSIYRRHFIDREHSRLISEQEMARLGQNFSNLMISGGNDYALANARHLINAPTKMDRRYILDAEVPFYQIVIHGYLDYAGLPINSREVQDSADALINMLATGAAPYFTWAYASGDALAFTPFMDFYSIHFAHWLDEAVEQYKIINEVYAPLKTLRIIGHEILARERYRQVTEIIFENGTKLYVNALDRDFETNNGLIIPAGGYLTEAQ